MLKNARLFFLTEPFTMNAATLEEQLTARRFRPCGPLESATLGWTPPYGAGQDSAGTLVHRVAHCLVICARRQERLLPATVISEALDERIGEIEGQEGRSVGRAERRRLREAITAELLPQAFTRSRRILAYLDPAAGWLVVDAASDKVAEELVSLLRETLGSLPAVPPRPAGSPMAQMTQWVAQGEPPAELVLGDACELRDPQDSQSVVRCRGQNLAGEEIAAHLQAGKQVTQLGLSWHEQIDFLLSDDLALKRLRLADDLLEENAELDSEDPIARFEAELTILIGAMRGSLARLTEIFALNQAAKASPAAPGPNPDR